MAFASRLFLSNHPSTPSSIDCPYPAIAAILKTGAKSTWSQQIAKAAVTADLHWLDLEVQDTMASGVDSSAVLDVGITNVSSPADGDWAVLVADLPVGHADGVNANNGCGGMIRYGLPVKVPSGYGIAVRGRTARGADTSAKVGIVAEGDALGSPFVAASSTTHGMSGTGGTSVTPGSDAFGSWTNIGSATAVDYQMLGLLFQPVGGTTVNRNIYIVELGWGSAVKTTPWTIHTATTESMNATLMPFPVYVPSGTQLQARIKSSSGNTIDAPRIGIVGYAA